MTFLKIVALALLCLYQVSCEEEQARQTNPRVAMNQKRELKDSPAIPDIPWDKVMEANKDPKNVAKEDAKKVERVDKATCPLSHPFAYLKGSYCCKYNREKVYRPQGTFCDGSIIGIDSKCCLSDAHTGCPAGNQKCSNYQATSCPSSHPFAYFGGSYCCKYNREKVYRPQGALCDGSIIDIDSKCCLSDAHTKCPAGNKMCVNYQATSCPSSHPFAYFGGSYCCKYNREKVYRPQGALCNGSIIGIDSKCCQSDAHTKCPAGNKMCANYQAAQPQPQRNVQCNWVANTGGDGTPIEIGHVPRNQPNRCATSCYQKSQSENRGISGALIVHDDFLCYCMVGMTKTVDDGRYTSCVFKVVQGDPKVTPEEKELAMEHFAYNDQDLAQKKK